MSVRGDDGAAEPGLPLLGQGLLGNYLDGLVGAISRVGTLMVSMGLLTGLILVVLYIDNFSHNRRQYEIADYFKSSLAQKRLDLAATIKKLQEQRSQTKDKSEIDKIDGPLKSALLDDSVLAFRIMRLENEMKTVKFHTTKIPLIGVDVATNDAPVVLGVFLVILSVILLVTLQHVNRFIGDPEFSNIFRENRLLLKSRLVLIYVPMRKTSSSLLAFMVFASPCFVMFLALVDTVQHLHTKSLIDELLWAATLQQALILFGLTLYLFLVARYVLTSWEGLRKALA